VGPRTVLDTLKTISIVFGTDVNRTPGGLVTIPTAPVDLCLITKKECLADGPACD
jgi:hypothetical protein